MQHFKFNELMKDFLTMINHGNKNHNYWRFKFQSPKMHIDKRYLEWLLNNNLLPQTTLPIRVAQKTVSLIDNICTNCGEGRCYSGNITTSISDHVPQVLVIKGFYDLNSPSNNNKLTP